jgi:hypothetical protein
MVPLSRAAPVSVEATEKGGSCGGCALNARPREHGAQRQKNLGRVLWEGLLLSEPRFALQEIFARKMSLTRAGCTVAGRAAGAQTDRAFCRQPGSQPG